jgi:hypothetical protein
MIHKARGEDGAQELERPGLPSLPRIASCTSLLLMCLSFLQRQAFLSRNVLLAFY